MFIYPYFILIFEKLKCAILWMRGHKPDLKIAVEIVYHSKQLCKIDPVRFPFSVGIDVLTEEGYILEPCGNHLTRFVNY